MKDTGYGTVEVAFHDGITILTLTRTGTGKRITSRIARAGTAAPGNARSDRSIHGCVLTGDGDVFYYATRCTTPDETGAQARFALMTALKALDKCGEATKGKQ